MIPEQIPVKNHYGNNSAINFEFDFLIESEEELLVVHTDMSGNKTILTNNIDYSINDISNENGSYITFPLPSSSFSVLAQNIYDKKSEMLSLSLNLPIEQPTEYDVSSNLNQTVLEKSFDYLTRICQIQERKIARAIKIPEGSDIESDDVFLALSDISNLKSIVDEIKSLPEGFQVGMVWKEFKKENWNVNGDYYTLVIENIPAPVAIFKSFDNYKILVNDVNILLSGNNSVLLSFEAFDGFILAAAKIVDTVDAQNQMANEILSVEISQIQASDFD